jgi:hypothetical protein
LSAMIPPMSPNLAYHGVVFAMSEYLIDPKIILDTACPCGYRCNRRAVPSVAQRKEVERNCQQASSIPPARLIFTAWRPQRRQSTRSLSLAGRGLSYR